MSDRKTLIERLHQFTENVSDAVENFVLTLSGEETKRAASVSLPTMYETVWDAVRHQSDYNAWLQDMYTDSENQVFAIINSEGQLFQLPLSVTDDGDIEFGEWTQVKTEFTPISSTSRMTIIRQADGIFRWVGIACTAILNKDGEIDSRNLFDSFIENIVEREQPYPLVDFMHDPRILLGSTDYLARDGYTLVASGTFPDDEIGRATAQGIQDDGDGYWGMSILYLGDVPTITRVAEDVDVKVYEDGVIQRITILAAENASAWFTTITRMEDKMEAKVKDELAKLLGDPELADKVEVAIDQINARAIDPNTVARSKDPKTPTDTQEGDPVTPGGDDIDPPEETKLEAVVRTILENQATLNDSLTDVAGVVSKLTTQLEATQDQVAQLLISEEQKQRDWLNDLPQKFTPVQITRPRQKTEGELPILETSADKASKSLEILGMN